MKVVVDMRMAEEVGDRYASCGRYEDGGGSW